MSGFNPVRVLFVIGSFGGGGAERQLLEILFRLDRTKFAPAVYLAYRRGELLPEVPGDVPVFAFDDAPRRSFIPRLLAKLRLPSAARAARLREVLYRRGCDLLFTFGLRPALEAALATIVRPVPRIAYCLVDPTAELELEFPQHNSWHFRLARWAYGGARRVYVNAEALRERLLATYHLPAAQVEVFYNLRDFDRLQTQSRESAPAWREHGYRLLTVGRLHEQKGQGVLLDAFTELAHGRGLDAQLVIVGQGPLEATLREQAARLQLADRVTFTGFLANPAPYYATADLFVLPSLYEGLPNALLEAVALGVPAVAADCPTGPREILEGGRFGPLVPPGNAIALADAIQQQLGDLDAARRVAAEAATAVRARHDIRTGIRVFEDRLLKVIGRCGSDGEGAPAL